MELIYDILLINPEWETIILGLIGSVLLWWIASQKDTPQLMAYIPTLWTSLGILFTFLVIYRGLTSINNAGTDVVGIVNSDMASGNGIIDQRLNDILALLSPAFSTSIIGIAAAIISSFAIKIAAVNRQAQEESRLSQRARAAGLGSTLSVEEVMIEMLIRLQAIEKHSCISQESLRKIETNAIKEFSKVANDIRDDINQGMAQANEELKKHLDDTADMIEKKVEEIATRMEKKAEETKNEYIRHINDVLSLWTRSADTLVEESKNRDINLKAYLDQIQAKAEALCNDMRQLYEVDIKEAIEAFAKEQYGASLAIITGCITELSAQAERCIKQHADDNKEYLDKTSADIKAIGDGITASFDKMSTEIGASVSASIGALDSGIKACVDAMGQSIASKMQQLGDNVDKAYADLSRHLDTASVEVRQQVGHFVDNLKKELTELKQHIVRHNQELSNDISQKIYNAVNVDQIRGVAESIKKTSAEFLSKLDMATANISQNLEAMRLSTEKTEKNYQNICKEAHTMNAYIEHTVNLVKEHQTTLNMLDASLDNMRDTLNGLGYTKETRAE